MKCHIRLLTIVVVGLSGATASNAADYGYGGGPWSPGYGTTWGNAGEGGGYGSSYGSGYDRAQEAPWGGAPYESISPQNPYPPPTNSQPWGNRGSGGDYYGPSYSDSGYGGTPNYSVPGYVPPYGGGSGYYGVRQPDYYWGNQGAGLGNEPGYRGYPAPGNKPTYGGYGTSPDYPPPSSPWGGASNNRNSNYGSSYNLPGPRPGSGYHRGHMPLPSGRYDRGWDSNQGYGYGPTPPTPPSPPSPSHGWEGNGSIYGSSSAYAGDAEGKNSYGSNVPSNPAQIGSGHFGSGSNYESSGSINHGFGLGMHEDTSTPGGGYPPPPPGGLFGGGGGNLIPSPAGGPPAGSTEKDTENSNKQDGAK